MWSAFPQSSRQGQVTCLAGSAAHHGPFWRNTRLHPHRPRRLARAARVRRRSPCASVKPRSNLVQGRRQSGWEVTSWPGHHGSWTPFLKTQGCTLACIGPSLSLQTQRWQRPWLTASAPWGQTSPSCLALRQQPCTHSLVGGPSSSCRDPAGTVLETAAP